MQRRTFPWMGLIILLLLFVPSPEAFASKDYTVARGDTLSGIAKKFGVTTRSLRRANHLQGDALRRGQVLVVPRNNKPKASVARAAHSSTSTFRYAVKKGDTIAGIAEKTGVSAERIRTLNRLRARSLKVGKVLILPRSVPEEAKENVCESGDDMAAVDCDEEGDEGGIAATEVDKDEPEKMELLGKWKSTEERQLFVKVAMGFLGAPYRLGGSSVRGLDCSAFVRKIYEFFGVTLPRTAREQAQLGIRVLRNELEAGDLVFFNTRRLLGHVGIYIGNNEFVHASSRNKGVRIDSLESPYYNRHFVKAVRLKDLDGDVRATSYPRLSS